MAHKIAIVYGSVRAGRLGIRAVKWMRSLLGEQGFETDVLDATEINLPLLERPLHHYDEGKAPEVLRKLATRLEDTDGFVIVAGEYNHAIQPGLSNLLDHFYRGQFGYKPGLIASYSYGPFGGVRSGVMLRAHLAELGMVTLPTSIAIGRISDSLSEEGEPQNDAMKKYAAAAMSELAFYTRALATEREKGVPEA